MSRIGLGVVALDLVVVVVGYAFLHGIGLARPRPVDVRLVGLAYLAGWALLGVVLSLALLAGLDPSVWHVLLVASVLCAVCVPLGRRARPLELVVPRPRILPAAALVSVAAVVLVVAAGAALVVAVKGQWPFEEDAWNFWMPRAETIYYFGGLDTGSGGWGAILHPEYPPLRSVHDAAVWHFTGGFHPSVLPEQGVVLGLAFLGSVLVLLDRFAPRWVTFPLVALLAVTPGFWWRLQTVMADPVLAYLVAAAAVLCVIWLHDRRPAWLALGVLFLSAASLTKVEGLSFAVLLVLGTVAAALLRHGRGGLSALVLLGGAAVVVPWRLWLHAHDLPTSSPDYDFATLLHPLALADRWSRFTYGSDWLIDSVFHTSEWLLVLPLALGAVVVAARRAPFASLLAAAWLALGFLGLATIYWIGVIDVGLYVGWSADRVAATLVILAGALAPLLLGLALRPRDEPSDPDLGALSPPAP